MIALGCVQSLVCNTNKCPTGVATQNPALSRGLDVDDKGSRVARFHHGTVQATMEIIASAGLRHTSELNRSHIFRRVSETEVRRFDEIYSNLLPGCLLRDDKPAKFAQALQEACAESFMPQRYVAETEEGLKAVK
jgi:hypothetical protein